jgi:hypothetical protein
MEARIVEQPDKMKYVVQMGILRPSKGCFYRKNGYLSLVLAVRCKKHVKNLFNSFGLHISLASLLQKTQQNPSSNWGNTVQTNIAYDD